MNQTNNNLHIIIHVSQLQRTKGKTFVRPSISSLKKSYKYQRSAIDLPTAEPYLDCTTDCEDFNESRMTATKNTFRMQFKMGHRSQTNDKSTSNQLIIISAQKSNLNTEPNCSKSMSMDIKENYVTVPELPAINPSKRHNAWQNMKKKD